MEEYPCLYAPGIFSEKPELAFKSMHVSFDDNNRIISITHNNAQSIIGPIYECVTFAEIDIETVRSNRLVNWITYYGGKIMSRFHDLNLNGYSYWINLSKFNIGQETDVELIQKSYLKLMNRLIDSEQKIFVCGNSRGSLALINWLAKYKPTNIACAVFDGTPSSVEDVVNNTTGLIHYWFNFANKLLPYVTSYTPNGLNAYDNVCDIPSYIPMLFVTSLSDKTVPYSCSVKLYNKLKDSGRKNVHIVILSKAGHTTYLTHNETDTKRYLLAIKELKDFINQDKMDKNIDNVEDDYNNDSDQGLVFASTRRL